MGKITEQQKIDFANKYAESKRSTQDDYDAHYKNDFEGFLEGVNFIISKEREDTPEEKLKTMESALRWFY